MRAKGRSTVQYPITCWLFSISNSNLDNLSMSDHSRGHHLKVKRIRGYPTREISLMMTSFYAVPLAFNPPP